MNIEIISVTPNAEKTIELAGRNCYNSVSKINKDSHIKFIKNIIKSGHESVLEHANVTLLLEDVSVSLLRQLERHRIASYAERSMRYVAMDQFEYIVPKSISKDKELYDDYKRYMGLSQSLYQKFRNHGIKKEDARFVVPLAATSKLVMTMNFRSLRNFLKLRLDKAAQWEIRELANEILDIILIIAPSCFEDLKRG